MYYYYFVAYTVTVAVNYWHLGLGLVFHGLGLVLRFRSRPYRSHQLPIEWQVQFKIACITYKNISINEPAYLHSLLKHYVPSP